MQDQDKLKEYLAKIPQDIKDIMYSLNYTKILEEVVKKHNLLIDQAGNLEVETTLVLAGLNPLKDYIDNLEKSLEISKEKAEEIAKDINELVFKNIRKSLEQINNEDIETEYTIEQTNQNDLDLDKNKLLFGIENPGKIEEKSISVSSLGLKPKAEQFSNGIEVDVEQSKKIPNEAVVTINKNVSPIENIVERKTSENIVLQKENIIIEEKTKLPDKTDQYREQI